MNDQTAQMGYQVGQKAVMAGQEYMEQSVRLSIRLGICILKSSALTWINRSIATFPSQH